MNTLDNGYFNQLVNGSNNILLAKSYNQNITNIAGNELMAGDIVDIVSIAANPFLLTITAAASVFTGVNSIVKLKFEAGIRSDTNPNNIVWKEIYGDVNNDTYLSDTGVLEFVVPDSSVAFHKINIPSNKINDGRVQIKQSNLQPLKNDVNTKVQTIQVLVQPQYLDPLQATYFRASLVASITNDPAVNPETITGFFQIQGQFTQEPRII